MDQLVNNLNLKTMQVVLNKISAIEAYNGAWMNVESAEGGPLLELRQLATVQSVGSSTRIEGSQIDDAKIDAFLNGLKKTSFTSRDEEEVAGYYETLEMIFENYDILDITENNIKYLHKLLLQHAQKDAYHLGEYKKHENKVVGNYPNGMQVTIFNTTPPLQTPQAMQDAVQWLTLNLQNKTIHPLMSIAIFVFEFLSIHPFQDGNGRLSRLLTTLLLLRTTYFYTQYVSFEHHIEKRKKEYYASLRDGQSTRGTAQENCNEFLIYFLDCMEKMTVTLEKKYQQLIKKGNYFNKRQTNVIQFIKKKGQVKLADLATTFKDVSNATLKKDLQLLVAKNKIEKTGKLKGTMYMMPDE
jgi:Fic family protein